MSNLIFAMQWCRLWIMVNSGDRFRNNLSPPETSMNKDFEDVYIEIYKKRFTCGAYSYSEYSTPSSDYIRYLSIGHHI